MSFFHSPRIVTDGLVYYYDFANQKCYPGSGNICYNLINPSQTGSLGGAVTFNPSRLGYLDFDQASTSVVNIQMEDMVNIFGSASTEFTVDVWTQFSASTDNRQEMIFYVGPAGADGFGNEQEIHINNNDSDGNNLISFVMEGSSTDISMVATASRDTFLNCTITATGMTLGQTTTPVTTSMHINGFITDGDTSPDLLRSEFTSSFIKLGRPVSEDSPAPCCRRLSGSVALVKIYNRALTEQEVLQNFNALRGRFGI
jgi:hypothetical protein